MIDPTRGVNPETSVYRCQTSVSSSTCCFLDTLFSLSKGFVSAPRQISSYLIKKVEALSQLEGCIILLAAGRKIAPFRGCSNFILLKLAEKSVTSVDALLSHIHQSNDIDLERSRLIRELQRLKQIFTALQEPNHPLIKEIAIKIKPHLFFEPGWALLGFKDPVLQERGEMSVGGITYSVPKAYLIDLHRSSWKIEGKPLDEKEKVIESVNEKFHQIAKGNPLVMERLTRLCNQAIGLSYLNKVNQDNPTAGRVPNASDMVFNIAEERGGVKIELTIPCTNRLISDPMAGPESFRLAIIEIRIQNIEGGEESVVVNERLIEEGFVTTEQILGKKEAKIFAEKIKRSPQNIIETETKKLSDPAKQILAKQKEAVHFFLKALQEETQEANPKCSS